MQVVPDDLVLFSHHGGKLLLNVDDQKDRVFLINKKIIYVIIPSSPNPDMPR